MSKESSSRKTLLVAAAGTLAVAPLFAKATRPGSRKDETNLVPKPLVRKARGIVERSS